MADTVFLESLVPFFYFFLFLPLFFPFFVIYLYCYICGYRYGPKHLNKVPVVQDGVGLDQTAGDAKGAD